MFYVSVPLSIYSTPPFQIQPTAMNIFNILTTTDEETLEMLKNLSVLSTENN